MEAWSSLQKAEEIAAQLEFRRMLAGSNDVKSAIVSINAGAGGVDSPDSNIGILPRKSLGIALFEAKPSPVMKRGNLALAGHYAATTATESAMTET